MTPDDNLACMSWRARPDMSYEYVNRAWLDFTGCTPEQALGEGWARCLHPEDLARWLDVCVRAFDAREPFEMEYRLRRRDGEYRWVLDRGTPRYSGDGVFLGFAGACVDIDAQKREAHGLARALERERRLRLAVEEAGRMRQGLLRSVLHELKPSAEAIATWAAYLRQQLPQESALQAIEHAARAQSRVIANLLELEHTESRPLLAGVSVLVVEPDGEARERLVKPLAVAGADVRAAASPAEALETLGSWQPDVLISESDEDFIRALRSLPAERGGCLHAAALTNEGSIAPGYDAHLAKPVEPVALLATVAKLAA